jgi:DNA-binding HxlR family transcriptional regulator
MGADASVVDQQCGIRRCSIARALEVVGDRWTLLILREAILST